MIEIGKVNTLRVVKEVDFGCYLDGGEEYGEILIPKRYVPEGTEPDHYLDVFIYLDSEDRIIATTEEAKTEVGDFASLKVEAVTKVGAFLDWGLPKDLLVPFSEQKTEMEVGKYYFVYVFLDKETERIAASVKVQKYLDNVPADYKEGDQVDLIIGEKTDIGYKVVINKLHSGLIYDNEIFSKIRTGDKTVGYIKQIREDEKIDVALQAEGYDRVIGVAGDILRTLKDNAGFLEVNDKSSPEVIKHHFGISKKVFKKAVGALYKDRLIRFDKGGIRLIESD